MIDVIIRLVITSVAILFITEIAKRSSYLAAIIASSPIATIASCLLLYAEKQPLEKIYNFSLQTALLLPPSLVFFIGFPLALKKGMLFWMALPLFIFLMFLSYLFYIYILKLFGVTFTHR